VRRADRIIAEIAAAHGGRYSMDIHRRHDPTASEEFARAHVRRLEAVRRGGGALERSDDGSWNIPPDYLERAVAFEEAAGRRHPVRVELLSPLPLQQLVAAEGATWLDKELVSLNPEPLRDAGFGSEVRSGLAMRRQWLVAEDSPRGLAAWYIQRICLRRSGDASCASPRRWRRSSVFLSRGPQGNGDWRAARAAP
jgi:hypothetical protein